MLTGCLYFSDMCDCTIMKYVLMNNTTGMNDLKIESCPFYQTFAVFLTLWQTKCNCIKQESAFTSTEILLKINFISSYHIPHIRCLILITLLYFFSYIKTHKRNRRMTQNFLHQITHQWYLRLCVVK